jgi:predicted Zn-dependent protease
VVARARQSAVGATIAVALLAVAGCGISEEQEISLGRENAEQIAAKMPLVNDTAITAYVQALGLRLASRTTRAGLPWRFSVIDSKDVNAFALPGGFIYVNRGLIERSERMDELAGVLGHEIGHVVRRHSVQQLKRSSGARVGIAIFCSLTSFCDGHATRIAIDVGGAAWLARHSRNAEAEADSEAVANTVRANISPEGIPALFTILLSMRDHEPGLVQTFFGSHPIEEERIVTTKHLVDRLQPEIERTLDRDDAAFQAIRERLLALPKRQREWNVVP